MTKQILGIAITIVLATAFTSAQAVTVFFDDFGDGVIDTEKWTVRNNGEGTITESGGRINIAGKGTTQGAMGAFGLIQATSFNRQGAGLGDIYLYYFGYENEGVDTTQNWRLAVSDSSNPATGGSDLAWAAGALGGGDIHEAVLRTDGVDVELALSTAVGGLVLWRSRRRRRG